jgi:uncharacterized protein
MRRGLWLALGWVFMSCGVVGIALPVVPTVPFLLVATWAFARSSPQLQQRILSHPTYGPPVRAWQERGAVGRIAKIWAITAMTSGVLLSWWLGMPPWVVAGQSAVCACVGFYLATRPEE